MLHFLKTGIRTLSRNTSTFMEQGNKSQSDLTCLFTKYILIFFSWKDITLLEIQLKGKCTQILSGVGDFPYLLHIAFHITTTQIKTQDISSNPGGLPRAPHLRQYMLPRYWFILVQSSKGTKEKLKNLPSILLSDTQFFLQRVNITGFL